LFSVFDFGEEVDFDSLPDMTESQKVEIRKSARTVFPATPRPVFAKKSIPGKLKHNESKV
jgi:hypothetical protein